MTKEELSYEQPSACSVCGSEDFEVDEQQFQNNGFLAIMQCNTCGSRWDENYSFVYSLITRRCKD